MDYAGNWAPGVRTVIVYVKGRPSLSVSRLLRICTKKITLGLNIFIRQL